MSKHTPGPWVLTYDKKSILSISDNGPYVKIGESFTADFVDGTGRHEVTEEQAIANARLMAAAPEMLVALVKVRDVLMGYSLTEKDMAIAKALVLDALAKAGGE